MKRIGFAVGLLGLLLVVIKVGGQTQPSLLQNGWLSGNTVPTSCNSGESPNFYNTSNQLLYGCVGNSYIVTGSPSITNQNTVGPDILNGKGNFATNGLSGWTSVDGGNIADWTIVSGNLHHNPASSQDDTLQAPLANIVQGDGYKMVGVVVSQTTGTAWLYLGDNCNSDCTDPPVGTSAYYATACCDSGPTALQIWASRDSNLTIASFTVYQVKPSLVTVNGTSNIAIGAGDLLNAAGSTGNTAIGISSLPSLTTGSTNIGLGYAALGHTTTGNYNVGIGFSTCRGIVAGSGNVCIGRAGTSSDVSNHLFIENEFSDLPLIGGDFNARTVILDATVSANHGGAASNVVCWMSDGKGIGHCSGALSGTPPTCTCAQ